MKVFMMKTTLYVYEVSTVSLPEAYDGMKLGAFETMIRAYKNEWLDYTSRYETEEEAIAGHIEAIRYVEELHAREIAV